MADGNQAGGARAAAGVDGELTLAWLLGVLYRRRWLVLALTALGLLAGVFYGLVTPPLFRATASVRPGITAYTERGDPVREWKLKDVTQFFNKGAYADAVRRALGWPAGRPRPIITADFIARGSQNIQGGDVVTLATLVRDPQEGKAILDAAIAAFNDYANADTLASGIRLTRAGLEVRIASLEIDKEKLASKGERLTLAIAEVERELAQVDAQRRRAELELAKVEAANVYRRALLATAEEQAAAAHASLADLDGALAELRARRDRAAAAGADTLGRPADEATVLALWLGQQRNGTAEATGNAVVSALQVRRQEQRFRALADSLRYEIAVAAGTAEDLRLRRDVDIERDRSAVLKRVGEIRLERDRDLLTDRATIDQDIRGKRAQLAALSPLERIGRTAVTARPVRPRRLRAAAILTLAGLGGSILLALAWEYLSTHRREILGRP